MAEDNKPTPFRVGKQMFVRIPEVGLCHMTSCGWTPCPEGVLTFWQNFAKGEEA